MIEKEITNFPHLCIYDPPIQKRYYLIHKNEEPYYKPPLNIYVPKRKSKAKWYFRRSQTYYSVKPNEPVILIKKLQNYDDKFLYVFLPIFAIGKDITPKEALKWDNPNYFTHGFYPYIASNQISELVLE